MHYKNNSTHSCTSHNIKDIVLRELVLDNIKQVISYISSYEDLFIKKINELTTTINKTKQEEIDLSTFIAKVQKYTEIKELTPEIVNELIDKIYVYQQIDIFYAGIGIIGIPLTEYELENAFQKSIKIKTA